MTKSAHIFAIGDIVGQSEGVLMRPPHAILRFMRLDVLSVQVRGGDDHIFERDEVGGVFRGAVEALTAIIRNNEVTT